MPEGKFSLKLNSYCAKWKLEEPSWMASTPTSDIFKVKFRDSFAVLKILNARGVADEAKSARVLQCFNGNGAVRLLEFDSEAYLLEHIGGPQLKIGVMDGKDDQATEIVADVVDRLHSYSGTIPVELISMERNFLSLFQKAKTEDSDSIYVEGAKLAERLINTEQDVHVLHGDIHHENILFSVERGWLAIDPKGLVGERTYDLANTFFNPKEFLSSAEAHETLDRRSSILSRRMKIDRKRILEYAFVYGCLSASWSLEDGQDESRTLRVARSILQFTQSL